MNIHDNNDVNMNSMYIESYKLQLDQLNSLLSPNKLFHEIDSIFRPYQILKRYNKKNASIKCNNLQIIKV